MGWWVQHKKFLFHFLNLDTDLSDLTQKILPTFDKLNKINEVWNSANPLFKWLFDLLSSGNFATMATWCNDFSSLLQVESLEGQT